MTARRAVAVLTLVLLSGTTRAGDYPAPTAADWVARDFKFHTGEVMPELNLHYLTIGEPAGIPVLVLHGNGGSANSMLTAAFAGELFGPGQALDASKYYIVIPDALGHGKSAKPSDGLKTKFPATTTPTWSTLSTGCSPKAWVSVMSGSSSATRWAE
jgi:homoserine O-acetyltransferase/O-succinyltransferase